MKTLEIIDVVEHRAVTKIGDRLIPGKTHSYLVVRKPGDEEREVLLGVDNSDLTALLDYLKE